MTPQRYQAAAENAEKFAMASTALVGAAAALLGVHAPELIAWTLALMGIDLLSGLLRALILPEERVDWRLFTVGALKKMALLLLLAPAAAVDRALHLSDLIADGAGPTAFALMIGLMMHESASITQNVAAAVGRAAVISQLLRTIDYAKRGGSPPERRTYDSVARLGEELGDREET